MIWIWVLGGMTLLAVIEGVFILSDKFSRKKKGPQKWWEDIDDGE